jgi:hypothetical protein
VYTQDDLTDEINFTEDNGNSFETTEWLLFSHYLYDYKYNYLFKTFFVHEL